MENIDSLIALLNSREVMSEREEKKLYDKFIRKAASKMVDGASFGIASGARDFYNQGYDDFREHLKNTDQDLEWQCGIVRENFLKYTETGDRPPPYFAWRIAVILRKTKEHEREKAFLIAYCRHFGPHETTEKKLHERLGKLLK